MPLSGHDFDATKANGILNKALSDPKQAQQLRDLNSGLHPSLGDKAPCERLGRSLRAARGLKLLGVLGIGAGAVSGLDAAESAYKKLASGGELSDFEKMTLVEAVGNSGLPGAGPASAEMLNLMIDY